MVSIIIDPDGNARHIYDDALVDFDRTLGEFNVKRASHVEPVSARGILAWFSEMAPVNGPKLGPYATRELALKAEKVWLENHDVPEVKP